jgi:hypothetical protein
MLVASREIRIGHMNEDLREHRRRLKERGLKRIEVLAVTADAELLRRVAGVLVEDNAGAEHVRAILNTATPGRPSMKFKDWLALPDDQP